MTTPTAVILGSSSIVAPYLLPLLAEAGYTGICLSRHPPREPLPEGFGWRRFDAEAPDGESFPAGSVLFGLLPLWLVPLTLPYAAGCSQLIAFGSTSCFSKEGSSDPAERALSQRLLDAEQRITAACAAIGLAWTVLRPTLVYDGKRDRNIAALARFISRFGALPLAAPASGLRQPIHARELAEAALRAIGEPRLFGRALNLVGGETLTYRAMVERIFEALGRPQRVVPLPPALLRAGFRLLRVLPQLRRYSPELFTRMNEDLVFDDSEARTVLGLKRVAFKPQLDAP